MFQPFISCWPWKTFAKTRPTQSFHKDSHIHQHSPHHFHLPKTTQKTRADLCTHLHQKASDLGSQKRCSNYFSKLKSFVQPAKTAIPGGLPAPKNKEVCTFESLFLPLNFWRPSHSPSRQFPPCHSGSQPWKFPASLGGSGPAQISKPSFVLGYKQCLKHCKVWMSYTSIPGMLAG